METVNLREQMMQKEPSNRTYRLNRDTGRISGMTDGLGAIEQAVYKVLMTERFAYPIYLQGYGIALSDLIGQNMQEVLSVLEDRITEALLSDDRITEVRDFEASYPETDSIHVSFTAVTPLGMIEAATNIHI
ncbi:MAG TPA: DUF2634 domain-containing protein [Firmicutes bacterium]|nr:DUF2634 domain-containing protein [Bacillota bacterium]